MDAEYHRRSCGRRALAQSRTLKRSPDARMVSLLLGDRGFRDLRASGQWPKRLSDARSLTSARDSRSFVRERFGPQGPAAGYQVAAEPRRPAQHVSQQASRASRRERLACSGANRQRKRNADSGRIADAVQSAAADRSGRHSSADHTALNVGTGAAGGSTALALCDRIAGPDSNHAPDRRRPDRRTEEQFADAVSERIGLAGTGADDRAAAARPNSAAFGSLFRLDR